MGPVRIEIIRQKCQAFGNCIARAPSVFALGDDRKVELLDPQGASEEVVLKAARSCPYRVIAISDSDGRQIFPPIRK
jgi:ferredoxin